jgi:hypothetical protein
MLGIASHKCEGVDRRRMWKGAKVALSAPRRSDGRTVKSQVVASPVVRVVRDSCDEAQIALRSTLSLPRWRLILGMGIVSHPVHWTRTPGAHVK